MRPSSPAPIYTGIGVTVAGFLLLVFAWSKVAGQEFVPLQMPFLVSGGFTGLALVMVGLVLVNVGVRRLDTARRGRETERVIAAVAALREALQPTDDDALSTATAEAEATLDEPGPWESPAAPWKPPRVLRGDDATAPLPPTAPPRKLQAL